MKYAFFPGCVLESAAKEDYMATVAVAKKLGIELEELDGWTCCGASHVQDIAPEMTALFGSSLAITISDIPFDGPVAGVVVGRVNGANFAALYGGTAAMGYRGAVLPKEHTWKSYVEFLLETLPEETRKVCRKKFKSSIILIQ